MNKREFLKSGASLLFLAGTGNLYASSENRDSLEEKVSSLREEVDNVPSFQDMAMHIQSIRQFYGDGLEKASKFYAVPEKVLEGIIAIEQGKPFEGFNTGLKVESPTGCKGLGQMCFPSFVDSCIYAWNILNKTSKSSHLSENIPESNLLPFTGEVEKANLIVEGKKDEILKQIPPITGKDTGEKYGEKKYELFLEEVEKRLQQPFQDIFYPSYHFGDKVYQGAVTQIEAMSAYLRMVGDMIWSWEFTIGTYNHGFNTTKDLINIYLGNDESSKNRVGLTNINEVITNHSLTYEKLFSVSETMEYMEKLKKNQLKFVDPYYYKKYEIARMELENFDTSSV